MEKTLTRGAGILMPFSSLPSPYGMGTLGKDAYEFVDQMVNAGQRYWQVLPIGPTSFGDSPYQSFSTFAGNPYFIDLDMLVEEGLLEKDRLEKIKWFEKEDTVSYELLWEHRFDVLREAFKKSHYKEESDYPVFANETKEWLPGYSLYMACKGHFGNREWLAWEEDIKNYTDEAVTKYRVLLSEDISFWEFVQFKFWQQWNALHRYANKKGIQIIGDIPIYVALDSADVWTQPEQFLLDENKKPEVVAGCPPDAFSEEGQKWGNPIYDWAYMEKDGFTWWKKRMQASARMYDVIRIDHFIGIVRYYKIPVDESAKNGTFAWGPGLKLLHAIDEVVAPAKIIAEDLGVLIPEVEDTLLQSGYPGMKVLEFAFDGNRKNPYLPHNYPKNCVVYGGTHDNDTLEGYYESLSPEQLDYAMEYCGVNKKRHLTDAIIKLGYASVADTVIFQMQDILKKDNSARMNYPSTIGDNWRYRMKKGEFTEKIQKKLCNLADIYGRRNQMLTIDLKNSSNEEIYLELLKLTKDLSEKKVSNQGKRKLYYISAEFLIGKLLSNNLINLGIYDEISRELEAAGKSLAEIEECEPEPSLGNGGLGRLAACFLDSIATLGLNGDGVGLNYHMGLFKQKFEENLQKETINPWIEKDSWLIKRPNRYKVEFGDFTVESTMYDIPVTGYDNRTNMLHLFDLDSIKEDIIKKGITFDKEKIKENLTLFLYPDDSDEEGLLLRVYQQYFMVSNGAQLILEEAKKRGSNLHDLAEYVAIQINDTHPSMVIPELIRLLTKEGISMDEAIEIVTNTCAYTNHTILAEALEKWPISYLEKVAPSIVPIIKELDSRIKEKYDEDAVQIIDKDDRVHMAHMDIHYGYSVNGVAYLHTEILKNNELNAFYKIYPEKFNNKTNGITFRRWLLHCNHALSDYLQELLGSGFKKDAMELEKLLEYVDQEAVQNKILDIKQQNKDALAAYIKEKEGISIPADSIFDIQVKRLHEYKRQQLNALYAIHKYLEIKAGKKPERPITLLFGAKAAPAYTIAKDIIHLILCLQQLTNEDKDVSPYLRVGMVENYNVTYAEKLIPACDISEQISLASKEASGTGNMKFMLNGAVTLGTMDGANVEINQLVGKDNIYIFGEDSDTVIKRYEDASYVSKDYYDKNEAIKEAVDFITSDEMLAIGKEENLTRLQNELLNKDWFMTFPDFDAYVETKEKAYREYENRQEWAKKMIVNIAKAGFFSSDRTIAEYNEDIWKL